MRDLPDAFRVVEPFECHFSRVLPADLAAEIEAGALVVDARDSAQRLAQGGLPGAYELDLTVLEWRLAPSSEHRILDVTDGQMVVLVCSDGYRPSFAASRLQDLGLTGATDLVGGFTA